ncbi:helix-turn-helix domain-containing protein [Paenibacillus graminis]|uniref:helix-turn-helix domain-containing protein n=1 Tax=Paenibacillus graminis TaxID=189425 RepID=UPI002DBADA83|nr:helix-turn-helix domain-containing protein [Paenibacillus graminis]MEC0172726.1 helix-turn-helix domain-containing protein [Paenibacillus graminis]
MTIFVRDLTNEEGNRLLRIARKGADPVQVRRALLILASAQIMKVPEISRLYHISGEHIRHTIHRFNQEGMASLQPKYGGGQPPTFTEEERADIIELAQIPPKVAGYPFTNWSLSKLKQAVEERGIVASISIETLRIIVNEAKIT